MSFQQPMSFWMGETALLISMEATMIMPPVMRFCMARKTPSAICSEGKDFCRKPDSPPIRPVASLALTWLVRKWLCWAYQRLRTAPSMPSARVDSACRRLLAATREASALASLASLRMGLVTLMVK